MTDLKIAIIGAGIIGLQVARELIERGETDFAIFEKNIFPGEHSSSRNSGVLHAGIYYPKDSLKQKLCVEGNFLWGEVAKNYGIPLERSGKFIVSTSSVEDEELQQIYHFVEEKKVPGVRRATEKEIAKLRDFVEVSNAFFSETTGVVSVSEVINRLKNLLFQKNIPLLLSQGVADISQEGNGYKLKVGDDLITTEKVINCAGLEAIDIRKMLGLDNYENFWVKGRYLKLNKPYYTESLIYPLPKKNLKGLGVHTSFEFDKIVRFGPDTEDVSTIDYSVDSQIIDEMYPEIKKIFKDIQKEDLSVDYAGIRSKIKKTETGEPYTDFVLDSPVPNYFECLGIESPGLTASPAIAKKIVSWLLDT